MSTTDRPKAVSDRVEGPIPEFDKYGTYTGYDYFRCRSCGAEAMRKADLRGGCACR